MNSTAKGNAFEDSTYIALAKAIQDGSLGLIGSNCRLFKKKGYFSRDRDSEIVVDLSIELWLPDATSWSILWVCECKDYSDAIPVDDVEEFKAKLDQITGKNVKGLMAVTGALQRGALNYAQANGIGVVRVLPESQMRWVLYQGAMSDSSSNPGPALAAYEQVITSPFFQAENQSFFESYDGRAHKAWSSLLRHAFHCESTNPSIEHTLQEDRANIKHSTDK